MSKILWLASYPKSGNTWLRAFLLNLLHNPRTPFDINRLSEFSPVDSDATWYRSFDSRAPEDLSAADLARFRPKVHAFLAECVPDTALVKTHNAFVEADGAPMITQSVTAGAIYIIRNPLDVALSYAHHVDRPVEDIITEMGIVGHTTPATETNVPEHRCDWSTHVESWTGRSHPALHVVRYEDMKRRPVPTFRAIAGFLGLKPPRERIDRAIRHSSFRALRAQEDRSGFIEGSSKQQRFFRAGKVDGWRAVLDDKQVRRVVEQHRTQMERFGYVPAGYESLQPKEAVPRTEASR